MSRGLRISIGQHSDKGRKETNQDFHGVLIPNEPLLGMKGIAVVLADGISSSNVSQIASESAVKSFLTDYYCTSESWSVKTSAQRVLAATNSWLNAQTRRSQYAYEMDKGYVCTFSAMVIKAATAHLFHVGDSRIYRVAGHALEQLTEDHRVTVSSEQSYLGRALGVNPQIEIDYRAIPLQEEDVFVLATDGVYEHVAARFIAQTIKDNVNDLDGAARAVVDKAYQQGSPDNLTIQIVRIDELPDGDAERGFRAGVRAAATATAGGEDDLRRLSDRQGNSRQQPKPYLSGRRHRKQHARRHQNSIHRPVRRPCLPQAFHDGRVGGPAYRQPACVEAVPAVAEAKLPLCRDGIHRRADLDPVDDRQPETRPRNRAQDRRADRQGSRRFHRMEMLHQDLRPENIMIDKTGTVKIIDFGSTRVAGVVEAAPPADRDDILGTVQYTAPEYFLGEAASSRSDLFSLGVITYQMLTGTLPYGAQAARARTRSQQRKLKYRSALCDDRDIPAWIDMSALKRAVQPDPNKRYEALSEFVYALRHPTPAYLESRTVPLLERNPALVWQCLFRAVLACAVLVARCCCSCSLRPSAEGALTAPARR